MIERRITGTAVGSSIQRMSDYPEDDVTCLSTHGAEIRFAAC